jgi:hypothetical protein
MKNLIRTVGYRWITSKACQELERIVFHGAAAIYFAGGIKEISQGRYLHGALDFSVGAFWEILQYSNEKSRYSMKQAEIGAETIRSQKAESIEAEIKAAKEKIAANQRTMAGLEVLMADSQRQILDLKQKRIEPQGKIAIAKEIDSHMMQLFWMYRTNQWYN